jgi:hypothetical protein
MAISSKTTSYYLIRGTTFKHFRMANFAGLATRRRGVGISRSTSSIRYLGHEPSPGRLPIAHHTLRGSLQHFCRLFHAETSKKSDCQTFINADLIARITPICLLPTVSVKYIYQVSWYRCAYDHRLYRCDHYSIWRSPLLLENLLRSAFHSLWKSFLSTRFQNVLCFRHFGSWTSPKSEISVDLRRPIEDSLDVLVHLPIVSCVASIDVHHLIKLWADAR